MKRVRMLVTLFLMLPFVKPVHAEQNFVEQFLNRYRPANVSLPASPVTLSGQDLADLIRSGQIQLSVGDVINLMLQNNLDVGVNRLTPRSSEYLVETLYRPFEPTLRLQATINRNTSPATSQLTGAPALSTLGGAYAVGFSQTLAAGKIGRAHV